MKSSVLFIAIFLSFKAIGTAQSFPEIRLTVDKNVYLRLKGVEGSKVNLDKAAMTINGQPVEIKEMHSRGNNSLKFERKSLSVDLKKATSIEADGKTIRIKKFDLLNLVMDKHNWHNRWAYLNMQALGIFPLYNSYCTLWINDQPQGIYLLVEKPHVAGSRLESPYMIRRGVQHKIDGEYIDTPSGKEAAAYKKQYLKIYQDLSRLHGEELYRELNAMLVLDNYFRWMAFNYLIMNGDYSDEVYLYIKKGTSRFDVIPWDYDDIFRPLPHEGSEVRGTVDRKKMIFSIEDDLDRVTATDPILYDHYLDSFRSLCNDLSEEQLKRTADQVLGELTILSKDPATANATRFLDKQPFDLEQARQDITISVNSVTGRHKAIKEGLANGTIGR